MRNHRILALAVLGLLGGSGLFASPQQGGNIAPERMPNLDKWQEWPRWTAPTTLHRPQDPVAGVPGSAFATAYQSAVDEQGTVHTIWRKFVSGSNRHSAVVYANSGPEDRQKDGFSKFTVLKEITIGTGAQGGDVACLPWDIACSPNGDITVAYSVDVNVLNEFNLISGSYTEIRAKKFTLENGWGGEQTIGSGSFTNFNDFKTYKTASLAYDFKGGLHAVVFEQKRENGATQENAVRYSKDFGSLTTIKSSPIGINQTFPVSGQWLSRRTVSVVQAGPNQAKDDVVVQAMWLETGPTADTIKLGTSTGGGSWSDVAAAPGLDRGYSAFDFAMDDDGSSHVMYIDANSFSGAPAQGKMSYCKQQVGQSLGSPETVLEYTPRTHVEMGKIGADSRKQPVIVFTESGSFLSFATKLGDPTQTGTWKFQRPLAIDNPFPGVAAMQGPNRVQVCPRNELIYVMSNSGDFFRSCEFNLGAQDAFTYIRFGPSTVANIATGNLNFELPLFTARSGAGFSTNFSLIYNSLEGMSGSMSGGWSTSYDMWLIDSLSTGQAPLNWPISIRFPDGHLVTYRYDQDLAFYVALDHYADFSVIRRDVPETGKYELRTKHKIKYTFDKGGRLEKIEDTNQNTLVLIYGDGSGGSGPKMLTEIRDSMFPSRPATKLAYDSKKRLEKVTDPKNQTYTLVYTDPSAPPPPGAPEAKKKMPHLETVQFDGAPGGQVVKWKFEYYEETKYDSSAIPPKCEHKNMLSKVFTPRGRIGDYFYQFGYQPDGRVLNMTEPTAPSVTAEVTLGAGPVQTKATREITYIDPTAATFDPPNLNGSSGPTPNVPKATVRDRRGFNTTIEYEYKRCLANRITDAQEGIPGSPGVIQRYFDGYDFEDPENSTPKYRNLIRFIDPRQAVIKYTYYEVDQHPANVKDNLREIYRPRGLPPTNPNNSGDFLPAILYGYTDDEQNHIEFVRDSKVFTTSYEYDSAGNLTRINHPIGFETFSNHTRGRPGSHSHGNTSETFGYIDSTTGLVTSITRSGGESSEGFEYDVMGNMTSHTVAGSGNSTFQYDNLYRMVSATNPLTSAGPSSATYSYDADSNLEIFVNARTYSTTTSYDALGRPISVLDSRFGEKRYDYDREGNVRRLKDFNTATSSFTSAMLYDPVGRVVQSQTITTNPVNGGFSAFSATTAYDLSGNLLATTISGGQSQNSAYAYDARGNLLQVTHPIASITDAYDYDNNDNLTVSFRTDTSLGQAFQSGIAYSFDGNNRAVTSTQLTVNPSGGVIVGLTTHLTYDDVGNCTELKDPSNRVTNYEYDSQSRLKRVKDHFGVIIEEYEYNDAGKRTKVKILSPITGLLVDHRTYFYNSAQQLETEIDALGSATSYQYDVNGNMMLKTDAKGVQTKLVYDELDRVIDEIVDFGGLNLTTHFDYDANGNCTLVRDARGKSYAYIYDAANRLVKLIYPGGSFETWTYDTNGRLEAKTDRAGTTTAYSYDLNNRVILESHGSPQNVDIQRSAYDGFGNPHVIDDGRIRIVNDYDELGRIISSAWSVRNSQGVLNPFKAVSYGYDNSSNRQFMIDPEGVTVAYEYDDNNRLNVIKRDNQAFVTFVYDAGGRLSETVYDQAGGATVRRSYNNRLDLTNIRTVSSTNALLASCTYTYDEVGNRKTETRDDLGVVKSYTYDRAHRLTGESWTGNDLTSAGFTNAFTDLTGANESGPSGEVTATPVAAITVAPYLALYAYDETGNRTRKQTSDGTSVCHYNDLNQLVTEDNAGSAPIGSTTATASSTHSGFSASTIVDGVLTDGQTAATVWRSIEAVTAHEVTVTLNASVPLTRIALSFPSGLGDIQQFKFQVQEGGGYADVSGVVALGAQPLSNATGYWRSTSRQVTLTFPEVTTTSIKFIQAAGGGPIVTPNIAWVTEIQLFGGVPSPGISYSYDANGNQQTRTEGNFVETFQYDYASRLSSYVKQAQGAPNATVHITYSYAPDGERYQRHVLAAAGTVTDALSSFMFDQADAATDYLQMNGATVPQLQESYVQGLSIDSKVARVTPGAHQQVHYYVPDGLGSVIQLIDSSQSIVNHNLTTAWGEARSGGSATVADRHGYTQREHEVDASLVYFRARSYDPRTGRFLQADRLLKNKSLKAYTYASLNPLRYVDPSGLDEITVFHRMMADAVQSAVTRGLNVSTNPALLYGKGIYFVKDLAFKAFDPRSLKFAATSVIAAVVERTPDGFRHFSQRAVQYATNSKILNEAAKKAGMSLWDYIATKKGLSVISAEAAHGVEVVVKNPKSIKLVKHIGQLAVEGSKVVFRGAGAFAAGQVTEAVVEKALVAELAQARAAATQAAAQAAKGGMSTLGRWVLMVGMAINVVWISLEMQTPANAGEEDVVNRMKMGLGQGDGDVIEMLKGLEAAEQR